MTFVLICVVVSSVSSVTSEQSDGVPHRLGISDNLLFLYKYIYRILQFDYQASSIRHSDPATDNIAPNLRDSAIKTPHVKQQPWKIF